MSKPLASLVRWLAALAVVLFLPASNVLLLMRPAFVSFEYSLPGFPPSDRFDPQTRLYWAQESVRYLLEPDDAALLREGRHISQFQIAGQPVYNQRELQHMYDVKGVLGGLIWVWRVTGLLLVAGLAVALWRREVRPPLARGILLGGVLLVGLIVAILLSALLNFDSFFTHFHEVFFKGNSWLFYYSDSLIQFYPLPFWMDATYILGGLSLLEGLVLGGISFVYLRHREVRK